MSRLCAWLTSVLVLFLPSIVTAQLTDPREAIKDQAIERKALEQLESIAERIPNLNAPENRILLSMSVADLLWSRDEERARLLYEDLTREMSAMIATVDLIDRESHQIRGWIQQLRQQVLDRLAGRDPELALTFLRATRLPTLSPNEITPESELTLEIHLAGLIAQKDSQMALRLARAALAKGVSHNLINLLSQLQQKNPEAAKKFHREVIDRFNSEDFNSNHQVVNIWFNLLTSFQPPQAEEHTYREFIDQLLSKVLRVTSGEGRGFQFQHNLYNQLRNIIPLVEKYSPARVAPLRQWSQMVEQSLNPSQRIQNDLSEIFQRATAQEMVALASKYPEEVQQQIYRQAVWKVMGSGEFEQARQIATEFLSSHAQQDMLTQIENRLLWKATEENNVAETRRLLLKAKSVDRVQILTNLAARLFNSGNREDAIALLDEAKASLGSMPRSSRRLRAQLLLVQSYSSLDLDQSVSLLELVIVHLNELIAAAAVLDGVENHYLRDGEWMMLGHSTLTSFVNMLDQNLGQLAIHDLDRAWRLSEQIERTEIRLKTQVTIVGRVLEVAIRDLPVQRKRIRVNLQ